MSMPLTRRGAELRASISTFLSERLEGKLEKLPLDDPKRAELQRQLLPSAWLEDAARRVSQIQAVTHSLKPLHPDAKGSSLFCHPTELPAIAEVGSHLLGATFDMDVVGNAAALDVYKFLKLVHVGRSLLDLAAASDVDFRAALSDDPDQADAWMAAFAGLASARGNPASHTNAKQLYWPVHDNVHDGASYHLLAPLYPTSLVHRIYKTVEDDRFGDATKAAREARKAKQMHDRPLHDYPNLAIQKLGGTKPQNISQLNSERRGDNLLFASLPPTWKRDEVRPLLNTDSLFGSYGWRVRRTVADLRRFMESDPARKLETRARRDAMVDDLLDELVNFTAEFDALESAWSRHDDCRLPAAHRRWLDPGDEDNSITMEDAITELAAEFSRWLNKKLGDPLPMGDAEYEYWRKLARRRLKEFAWEAADVR
jgi:CRISPR-associated protein Csy1